MQSQKKNSIFFFETLREKCVVYSYNGMFYVCYERDCWFFFYKCADDNAQNDRKTFNLILVRITWYDSKWVNDLNEKLTNPKNCIYDSSHTDPWFKSEIQNQNPKSASSFWFESSYSLIQIRTSVIQVKLLNDSNQKYIRTSYFSNSSQVILCFVS